MAISLVPNTANASALDAVKLSNEYGKSSTCTELRDLLLSMGYGTVEICPISLQNYRSLIDDILKREAVHLKEEGSQTRDYVVFNLCDGCETDGYPGISILDYLHQHHIPYTGSSPQFYVKTTSKPVLKRHLIEQGRLRDD
jgi:hypothetical protein